MRLTAAKPRAVLALLLANANATVPTDALTEELWEEDPPASAPTTLQTYILHLRKMLAHLAGDPADPARARARARETLVTRPLGYLLRLEPGQSDLLHFRHLVREGREAMEQRRLTAASALLREALGLWRGDAFAGVRLGPRLKVHAIELEEARLTALEWSVEVDLRLGRHQQLISQLTALTARYPLHEGLHSHLMSALCLAGRRSDALDVYRRLRSALVRDLGLEPSWSIQQTQQAVLRATSDGPPDVRHLLGDDTPITLHRNPIASGRVGAP
ncbi:AfsR/SARP family transcriptional regulator [Jidongwangia harbinensis]|uniref:AfsR/SARP family transcriptional regulator n=1 Tax=Jidongwangia harbinensis TaxID=2878561 RepID=UPI001CD9F02D|nr:AfsR/SARP family transcriptional regulator [Jidongwangia harbinensis]MCA2211543.1 AfsR/SARP family transcriptional regulator [Jidongwangia harbinensis]